MNIETAIPEKTMSRSAVWRLCSPAEAPSTSLLLLLFFFFFFFSLFSSSSSKASFQGVILHVYCGFFWYAFQVPDFRWHFSLPFSPSNPQEKGAQRIPASPTSSQPSGSGFSTTNAIGQWNDGTLVLFDFNKSIQMGFRPHVGAMLHPWLCYVGSMAARPLIGVGLGKC